jgi:hypothetical protein
MEISAKAGRNSYLLDPGRHSQATSPRPLVPGYYSQAITPSRQVISPADTRNLLI